MLPYKSSLNHHAHHGSVLHAYLRPQLPQAQQLHRTSQPPLWGPPLMQHRLYSTSLSAPLGRIHAGPPQLPHWPEEAL